MVEYRRRSRAERRRKKEERADERRKMHLPPVKIENEQRGRLIRFYLKNPMVAENCYEVKDYIWRSINPPLVDRVIVDLSGVPFMDSTALGLIVDIKKQLGQVGVEFLIANPTKQVRLLIETLLLDKILKII